MSLAWDDVRLLLFVARTGSVRAAARALGIDASTVSRRLGQLESTAGAVLFRRLPRGLALAPAGESLVRTAEEMERALAEATRDLARRRGEHGVVRISALGAFAGLVADATRTLRAKHPTIEVQLLSSDTLASVDGAQVDVALRGADTPPEDLVGIRLGRLRVGIYAAKRYARHNPMPLEDAGHGWVDWDRRLLTKPAFHWLRQTYPEQRVVARGMSTLDVLALVKAGVGVGALPRFVGDQDAGLVLLGEVPAELATSVWLLTAPEVRTVARIRLVVGVLKSALHEVRSRM